MSAVAYKEAFKFDQAEDVAEQTSSMIFHLLSGRPETRATNSLCSVVRVRLMMKIKRTLSALNKATGSSV